MNSVLNKRTWVFKYQDIIALFCLLSAAVFLIWKAPHGFGFDEDSFYVSLPYRLTMGDSFLTDEWHLSQLSGFLLYLPVKAYVLISGSTEGIILFFRYFFIVFQSIISTVIYCRLRKYGLFAILAALIFYLNIPYTIMALSYNSMGVDFVLLAGLLMSTMKKHSKATLYITGLIMACAVLCNPILVFVYLLFTFCVVIYEKTKNKKNPRLSLYKINFSVKTWLWISLGIFTMAAMFFIFLFSRTTISEIIKNVPYIFKDSDYVFSSAGGSKQNIITIQKSLYGLIKFNPYLASAYAILMAVIIFDKKRLTHRLLYLFTVSVIFSSYIVFILLSSDINIYLNCMFPLAFFGITCYVLTENKEKNLFVFFWMLGALYAVCLDITSDMGTPSVSVALSVSSVPSVIFIRNSFNELREQYKTDRLNNSYVTNRKEKKSKLKTVTCLLAAILTATLLFQIYMEFHIAKDFNNILAPEYAANEYFGKYLNAPKEKPDFILRAGPEKGLKTTAEMGKS